MEARKGRNAERKKEGKKEDKERKNQINIIEKGKLTVLLVRCTQVY